MPSSWFLLMAVGFLMVWVLNHFNGSGYYCPGCGAKNEKSHHPECGFRDRW